MKQDANMNAKHAIHTKTALRPNRAKGDARDLRPIDNVLLRYLPGINLGNHRKLISGRPQELFPRLWLNSIYLGSRIRHRQGSKPRTPYCIYCH
ncbi:Protein of unknown function [Gryllus bimaculatus]|nr:Protein of unknown function [Gryllus bimaculatus]